MKSMMDTRNYIAASEYLDKFDKNEMNQNIGMLCKNLTIDSMLKYYMNIANNKDINFKVDMSIPEDINIDRLDLSVVIGNCIENAIEACDSVTDTNKKYVDIKAEIKGCNLVI